MSNATVALRRRSISVTSTRPGWISNATSRNAPTSASTKCRLAVTFAQVDELGLVPAPGKRSDTRAASFEADYGQLIQVEVEAIDPGTLEELVVNEVSDRIDFTVLGQVQEREQREQEAIHEAAAHLASVFEDES